MVYLPSGKRALNILDEKEFVLSQMRHCAEAITDIVARKTGYDPFTLRANAAFTGQKRGLVNAKRMLTAILSENLKRLFGKACTLQWMADFMNARNHSSIVHSVNQHNNILSSINRDVEKVYQTTYEEISRQVSSLVFASGDDMMLADIRIMREKIKNMQDRIDAYQRQLSMSNKRYNYDTDAIETTLPEAPAHTA